MGVTRFSKSSAFGRAMRGLVLGVCLTVAVTAAAQTVLIAPFSALAKALQADDDEHVPLISAEMLALAGAAETRRLYARWETRRRAERETLIRTQLDALTERWQVWKLDDALLTDALVNLMVDVAVARRFYDMDAEYYLTFDKSIHMRLTAFLRQRMRGELPQTPQTLEALVLPDADALARAYAAATPIDLTTPAGRLKALVLLHVLRSDPKLGALWEQALVDGERLTPGFARPYRQVMALAADLPLGRLSDLTREAVRTTFADNWREAGETPKALPFLPVFVQPLNGVPRPWPLSALADVPAVHFPSVSDWRVECAADAYRVQNRYHRAEAERFAAMSDLPEAKAFVALHRRWQNVYGLLESLTPEQAHTQVLFAPLPKALYAPEAGVLPALTAIVPAWRFGEIKPAADGRSPLVRVTGDLLWLQVIEAELPGVAEDNPPPDWIEAEGVPALVDPEGAAELAYIPPPARRVQLYTLRRSPGEGWLIAPQAFQAPPGISLRSSGPEPAARLTLPE